MFEEICFRFDKKLSTKRYISFRTQNIGRSFVFTHKLSPVCYSCRLFPSHMAWLYLNNKNAGHCDFFSNITVTVTMGHRLPTCERRGPCGQKIPG